MTCIGPKSFKYLGGLIGIAATVILVLWVSMFVVVIVGAIQQVNNPPYVYTTVQADGEHIGIFTSAEAALTICPTGGYVRKDKLNTYPIENVDYLTPEQE